MGIGIIPITKAIIGTIQKTCFSFFLRLIFLTTFLTLGLLEENIFSNFSKFLLENIIPKIHPINCKIVFNMNLIKRNIIIKNKKFGKIPEIM